MTVLRKVSKINWRRTFFKKTRLRETSILLYLDGKDLRVEEFARLCYKREGVVLCIDWVLDRMGLVTNTRTSITLCKFSSDLQSTGEKIAVNPVG